MTRLIRSRGLRRTPFTGVMGAVGVLALSALCPSALVAQDSATPYEAIDDAGARTAIRTLIADAAAKGLPTSPLVTKVREGIAKRATPDRIRNATSLLVDRLEKASSALAPTRSSEELAAGADALQAGVPASTLRDMRKLWPGKPLTVPLGVLSEMVASGVSQSVATRRVRELLIKGASSAQFASMGTEVRNDIASGLAPNAAMELRSKGVISLLNYQAQVLNGMQPASPAPIRPGTPPKK
ncbi:MAG TPA: hypothetical protein DGD08_17305 [Gemmatimonas aurantiaca]|uniref:DUF4197 domain-containing protein n=2 Tax=Gemmatimonas aurantiaca TaxID=173480 RepID=C1AEL5_GEMAT|nr:hypothetical protein [Gemmatimonas aurantiaca]BAH40942.1 hypothetical protein GAU_3900 [Gemmatimonas aurantiaca T-27]HCT58961.1 hypothetical protein [Gemmatimonas aurantiaca]